MEPTAPPAAASLPTATPAIDPALVAATNLIAHFEQYLAIAQWDVNAYRNGFGSDTDGAAQTPVFRGEVETRADALANLAVRVPKYMAIVEAQVGPALYAKLGAATKAGLASMAYNYGRVPQSVVAAVLSNSSKVSDAVRACGRDNHGINQWRRDGEAAAISLDGGQY